MLTVREDTHFPEFLLIVGICFCLFTLPALYVVSNFCDADHFFKSIYTLFYTNICSIKHLKYFVSFMLLN